MYSMHAHAGHACKQHVEEREGGMGRDGDQGGRRGGGRGRERGKWEREGKEREREREGGGERHQYHKETRNYTRTCICNKTSPTHSYYMPINAHKPVMQK